MSKKITKEDIMPILERKAKEIKASYDDSGFEFLGGCFPVQLGIYGYLFIEMNSNGKIMKIKTPEGAYLRP